MRKTEIKDPAREKNTGAYSSAVEIDGWVYVSGQGPVDPKTAQPIPDAIEEETALVLGSIERILREAGCSIDDIVKCTVHLADMEEFDRYNRVYREFFKTAKVLPVRTTVQSVLWKGIKIEIDCVARKPG
ncbi:MAG TPA: RidA family protein [Candidatus Saccharimonadales bacterium]|nr:RidA family protein [Candidatus Saccharimonadales bacterium]